MAKIGGGFSASPSALHSHADRLSDRSGQVSDVGSRAQGAGLHGSALGAVGEGSAGSHQQLVGRLGSAAGRAGTGLRHQSDLLHRNASSMQEVEDHHRRSFEQIDPSVRKASPAGHQAEPTGNGPGRPAPGARPTTRTTPHDTNENTDPRDTAVPGDGRVCKSDPVDVASGEVITGQRDVELPGLLRLVFDRTHVSSYRSGRWFGPSWTSTVDQRLEVGDAGVRFFAPDGMILVYPSLVAGEPTLPVEGPRWPLTLAADGTLSLRDTTAEQTLHFDRPDPIDRTARLRAITGAAGHRIDLAYDAEGNPVELRHSGGYRVGLTVASRRITALRLIGADTTPDVPIMRYGYDEQGRLTEVVNSSGLPTLLRYDDAGRLAGWQDRNGLWYRYEYDQQGRCIRTIGADGFLSSQFAYDTERRRTSYTDSLGNVTTYDLNAARQLLRETDPLGNTTSFEWDRYDRKLSETDPAGRVTRFAYDEDGRLTRIDYPDGTSTSAVLSPTGAPATITAPDGVSWLLGEHGGTTMLAGPDGVTIVSRSASERGMVRNAAGLIISETDESGATTRIEYDQFGRPVTVTGPQGGVTRHGWTVEGLPAWQVDPDGSRHSWRYDAEGNEIEYTDPAGRTTRTEYAGFDLPVTVTDPLGARTEYRYDTELRVTEIRAMQGSQDLTWRYEYDPAGRVSRTVDFDGRRRSYRYDPLGRVVAATDPAGVVTEFDHDAVGNTVAARRPDGSTSRYAYDGLDRLVLASTTDTELVLERDEFGRVVAETVNGRTVRTGYDLAGRMVRRETPSGAVSEWTFDATGNPVELRTGGQAVVFGHDGVGRETERRVSLGFHLTQSYGMTDGPTTQAVSSAPGPVHRKDFRYRSGGELAGVRTPAIGSQEFDVDAAGQVVGVRSAGWQERYHYDAMGNVVFAQWPNGAICSPASGERRYTGTVIESAGGVRYRHDAYGRRVASETADGVRRYTWDADDRLVGVSNPDGTRWEYRYDGRGRRVAKHRIAADGTVLERTDFSWADWQLVEQVRTAVDGGRHVVTWDYHPTDGTVLTQVEQLLPAGSDTAVGVRWYTVLTDQVGTPTELFTPTGELAWQRRQTLWGLAEPRGGVDIPLRFPGQYHDAETGLYYNTLRYYDPETARFLSPDPLGLVAALNPVSYVPNPLVWVDPLGLAKEQCAPGGQGGDPGKGNDPNKKPSGPLRKFGSRIKKAFQGGGRSSSRLQQAPSQYQNQRWWHENYGPHTTFGGGTGAHVQLGPASGDPIPGHSHLPGHNELTAVNQLGSPPWIKGHIVNSNLGGRNNSQNLTPLTSDANGSHLHNVETPIKNAVTTASQSGRFDRHDPYWYGVDFNTRVQHASPVATNNPQSAVAHHIDINSHYIRRPRVGDGPVEPVPPGQLPANRPWPQLPNGRLDPRTGAWTPATAPAAPPPAPAVPGPSHAHTGNGNGSDAASELSSPPPSNGDVEMVNG